MERFNLNTWLEDKSRKIVTRDGKPARIICYDVKQGKDDCYVPIIALVDKGEEFGEMSFYYPEDGSFLRNPNQTHNLDLFFADEEEELTELQKTLEADCDYYAKLYNEGYTREELREWIKCWCHRIIDLARNEIEKENPYSGNQKQEWSEDDEHCIELLLPIIDSSSLIPKNRKRCKEFLKSLKDRVKPQSKQEWSEEDKSMYIRTLGILGKCYMGELPTKVEEELKWFKSIESQSHWKPSKEQMNALDNAKNSPANYHNIRLGLQSLYNDLLKL